MVYLVYQQNAVDMKWLENILKQLKFKRPVSTKVELWDIESSKGV